MPGQVRTYLQAARLEILREMLETERGVTYAGISKRFEIARASAIRMIAALRNAGHNVLEERDGKTFTFRIPPSARRRSVSVTLRQVAAFQLARQAVGFLAGTGLDDDLDDLGKRLVAEFTDPKLLASRRLERKFFSVPFGRSRYGGSAPQMADILDGLFNEEHIEFTTEKPDKGRRTFRGTPLTLQAYRGLLYFIARSSGHAGAVRTFGFHTIVETKRLAGEKFEYPEDYDPRALIEGAFGIVGGKLEDVCVRFAASVAPIVTRRVWHATQSLTYLRGGGVEVRMRVRGLGEVREWVLGFGEHAEVIAPRSLRADIARTARAVWQAHRGRPG